MGDESITKALKFFLHPDAEEYFAKLDFILKNGVYIQNRANHEQLFEFISENKSSLKEFYLKFYNLNLDEFGEENNKFYFLDFFKQSRNNRERLQGQYTFLKNEFVLVGFLIFKIQFIDRNFTLSSVKELKRMIRQDNQDLKNDIRSTIAGSSRTKPQEGDDSKIDDVIDNALSVFKDISWVILDGDFFETLPAFQRIHQVYGDDINNYFERNQE